MSFRGEADLRAESGVPGTRGVRVLGGSRAFQAQKKRGREEIHRRCGAKRQEMKPGEIELHYTSEYGLVHK